MRFLESCIVFAVLTSTSLLFGQEMSPVVQSSWGAPVIGCDSSLMGSCDDGGCAGAGSLCSSGFPCLCGPTTCGNKNWVDVDYVTFWNDGYRTPPLLTSAPAGTDRTVAGVLGASGTSNLLGPTQGDGSLSGVRIGFGHWLDDCGNMALTGSLFFLDNDDSRVFPGDDSTIVTRPFFNTSPTVNAADAELVNFPGDVSGTATIATDTSIFSGDIGLRRKICCCADASCCRAMRLDGYFGYRTFSFDEDLTITERLAPAGGFVPLGTEILVVDSFRTENEFHGVEFGILSSMQRQRWVLEAGTRVALGNIRQTATIAGSTTTTVPGFDPAVQPYGFLAAPSNIGTYQRDEFGVMTNSRLEIGYWLSCRLKLQVGYNLVFLNSVVRPGHLIDDTLNTTQIDPLATTTAPASPAFAWRDDSLLLHGISVGGEFRF